MTAVREQEWYLRLRQGLPVVRLGIESEEAWAENARFAQAVVARLQATEILHDDDRLTAGYLEHLLGGWMTRV